MVNGGPDGARPWHQLNSLAVTQHPRYEVGKPLVDPLQNLGQSQ